jgi:uncharacterized protein (DUF2336 family)
MIIAAGCAAFSEETAALAAYLRVSGQLTAGLALRGLLCGQTGLFAATLVELTGMGPRRVAGLIREPASTAFAAVYDKAGLPAPLMVAFRAALIALYKTAQADLDAGAEDGGALRLPVIQFVLSQCEAMRDESLGRLIALLRRFEADAARESARGAEGSSGADGRGRRIRDAELSPDSRDRRTAGVEDRKNDRASGRNRHCGRSRRAGKRAAGRVKRA